MLCFCLITLTLLHGSHTMQDEFLRLQSTNWSRTEAGPKQGPYQHLATLETQDLSPLYASWNRDVGPSVGHTGGYLKQPTASSYMFPHFASQSPDLPLPSHLLNDEPQGHFLQLPGSPYSIPQHPMSYLLDEFPLYALNHVPDGNWASHMLLPQAQERNRLMIGSSLMEDHGAPLVPTNADVPRGASSQFASVLQSYDLAGSAPASRTALPQAQREDLDRIESSLFEYGDAIQTSTAALPGWASTDIAPVPDSSDSTRFMPWMVYFREWQDKQNAGGSGARQTGGSSTGDFRIAERDGQSNDSVQEASILGSTRMCELGPGAVPLQQQPEKNRNQKSISRSILTNLNSHQSQIDLASPTASNLGYISSVDLLRCRFNPDAPFSPKVELSDYMHILRSATTFQRRNAQRINMLKRSVSMWLPVYTTTFKPEWQSSQMEAKLAILFEHLWLINSWLLYSFDFENIKEDIHYVGQDDMMSWVVENLIGRLPVFTFLKPNSQNFVGIQKHIEKYLGAPRVTTMVTAIDKKRKNMMECETENLMACRLAVYILESYYQTNNWKRYNEAFSLEEGIYSRLHLFTTARIHSYIPQWKANRKANYGKIMMVPWYETPNQQEGSNALQDKNLKEKMTQICSKRLLEISKEAERKKYKRKRILNKNRLTVG